MSDDLIWCEADCSPYWCKKASPFGEPICDKWDCPGKIAQEARDMAEKHLDWFSKKLTTPQGTDAMTEKITREEIEALIRALQAGQDPFADGEVDALALCALALQAEAMQPILQDLVVVLERLKLATTKPEEWGPWLEWAGTPGHGPNFDPAYEVTVEVQRRHPRSQHFMIAEAHKLYWGHSGCDDDIMFFREKLQGQKPLTSRPGRADE